MSRWSTAIALAALVGLASAITVTVDSLLDPERLVPVSSQSFLGAIPLVVLCYFLGLIVVGRLSDLPDKSFLFSLAFGIRLLAAAVLAVIFQYDDERLFHEAARQQAYGLWSWIPGQGFNHFCNLLYALFGTNLLLPKTVNALLGSLLPFLAYDMARHLFGDPRAARRAFWFTAVLPPAVVFSAVALKEMATALLLFLCLWCLACWRRTILSRLAGAVACVAVLYWLRGLPWAATAIVGGLALVVTGERSRIFTVSSPWVWARGSVVAMAAVILSWLFLPALQLVVTSRLTQERYFMQRFAQSSATVMSFVDLSDPLSPKNVATLFLRGLYSPSPIRFLFDYDLEALIEAGNMLVWYGLVPFGLIGVMTADRRNAALACGLTALGVLGMATVGVAIGSDPYRHRFTMLPMLLSLSAGGVDRSASTWGRGVVIAWWLGAVAFTALWIFFHV